LKPCEHLCAVAIAAVPAASFGLILETNMHIVLFVLVITYLCIMLGCQKGAPLIVPAVLWLTMIEAGPIAWMNGHTLDFPLATTILLFIIALGGG
jgi:hypothetical protein